MKITSIIDRGPSVAPRGRFAVYTVDDEGNHERALVDEDAARELAEHGLVIEDDEDGDVDIVREDDEDAERAPAEPPAPPAVDEPVRTAAQKRRDAKLAAEAAAAAENGDDA